MLDFPGFNGQFSLSTKPFYLNLLGGAIFERLVKLFASVNQFDEPKITMFFFPHRLQFFMGENESGVRGVIMNVDAVSGMVQGARFVPSPNCDQRPDGVEAEVLVIHSISLPPGQFGGPAIEQLFCNTLNTDEHPYYREIGGLKVSSHILIRRNGEIIQFAPFTMRAWHAGQSCCEGRTRVNDFSIGIELEGADDVPFEEAQYQVLAELTRAIQKAYPGITRDRIYGHGDIAPGRKTDPGPSFDWERYLHCAPRPCIPGI